MSMATETMIKADQEWRDARMLHDAMEKFTRDWQPSDRGDAAHFHADLLRLVRIIHQDAARPYHDLMMKTLQAFPPTPLFREPSGE